MSNNSSVLVYGTNLGGYRAAYALSKKGHKVILLNRGRYVDEIKYQAISQLPLDFCWICGHMPQRLFKALGALQDNYNAKLLSVSGKAGDFKVEFQKKDQIVNNFACIECDRCVDACPVEVGDRKAIYVNPEAGWENIYLIDIDNCTRCGECEKVCPTGCLKIDRPEERVVAEVGAIVLALEYESPGDEDLAPFGAGKSDRVVLNSEISKRSLLTNFVKDSVKLPSGEIPDSYAIIVTPHFNKPGVEYENFNLCVTAAYRAVKLKEIIPEAEVTIFLRNYMGFGKGHVRWLEKALSAGAETLKLDGDLLVEPSKEHVTIKYGLNGSAESRQFSAAILVTGQKPPTMMKSITEITGAEADEMGFCRIRPFSSTETTVDGIYAVGEFTGPKGNPETVWDGCAAVSELVKHLGAPNFKPDPPPALTTVKGEPRKVGVFICSCFDRFSEKMDLDALRQETSELAGVSHAEIIEGCCTPPTIKSTAQKIKDAGVNRVVLAVCTPLQKLLKFRKTVMLAGLNPLLSQYVRLREDVINVHSDQQRMLAKSLALIRGAVEAVKDGSEAPPKPDKFVKRALVLGGGVSGLAVASAISAGGAPVTLVEKEGTLGSATANLEEDQIAYVQDLVKKVEGDENIHVITGGDLRDLDGYAGNFTACIENKDGLQQEDVGVIILATGAKEYQPEEQLLEQEQWVITQSQLQTMLQEKETGLPGNATMIQCVGFRNEARSYCSRICCSQALRNAIALSKKGVKVSILYQDIVCYGKENFYDKALNAGVKFIRIDHGSSPETHKDGDKFRVTFTSGGEERSLETEAVVLSVGIVPGDDNARLSDITGLPLDQDGFFDSDANAYPFEEAIKRLTKPFELATNMIFPIGLAHSPRSFEETLLTARDAAGRALVLLFKGQIPPPNAMYIAGVVNSLCMGCGVCVNVCPYSARYIDTSEKVAAIHPFLCDSCGSCVAACPNNASYLRDFTGRQAIATIDALVSR